MKVCGLPYGACRSVFHSARRDKLGSYSGSGRRGSGKKRREVSHLILDGVTRDGCKNVNIAVATLTEDFAAIAEPVSTFPIKHT